MEQDIQEWCNCYPLQENMILKSMWQDQTHKLCRIFVSDNAPEQVPKFSLVCLHRAVL